MHSPPFVLVLVQREKGDEKTRKTSLTTKYRNKHHLGHLDAAKVYFVTPLVETIAFSFYFLYLFAFMSCAVFCRGNFRDNSVIF